MTTHAEAEATEPDAAGFDVAHHGGPRLSWGRLVLLVAAFCFLAGAVGYFLAQDHPPAKASVDVGFSLDMIRHHEQAVQMALIELSKGESAVVRAFAQEIVIFQQWEIGRMDQLLSDWGYGRDPDRDTAMGWMDMPVPIAAMPGMASDEQLDALRSAQGAEADALFLDLMAEHHRGGVHMAAYAADKASSGDVRDLAARMARNQSVEINEFIQTAERLGFDIDIAPYDAAKDPYQPGS